MISKPILKFLDTSAARTIVALVVLLAAAQMLTLSVMTTFIMLPQAQRLAGIMAQNVMAVAETAERLSPEDQTRFMARLSESPYLRVHQNLDHWPEDGSSPSYLESLFLTELTSRLTANKNFEWRRGSGGRIWIAFNVADKRLWVSTKPPDTLRPELAVVLAAAFSVALAAIAGLILQRLMNASLLKLTAAAHRVSLGGSVEQVPVFGPREFRDLAKSFNRMTERLANAERERNLMLAGISHDLRTPLSKVRLAVEMLPDEADKGDLKAIIVRQCETMDAMLAQFLDFARGLDQEAFTEVLPGAVLSDVIEASGHTDFQIIEAPARALQAKSTALHRAIANLVHNAKKYGRPPFTAGVTISNDASVIWVRDHGPGLSEADRARVIEPFVRGDDARSGASPGSGLGLAIVARVAKAHRGRLELENAEGGGLMARVVLPI